MFSTSNTFEPRPELTVRSIPPGQTIKERIDHLVCPESTEKQAVPERLFGLCDGGIYIVPGDLSSAGTVLARNAQCFALHSRGHALNGGVSPHRGGANAGGNTELHGGADGPASGINDVDTIEGSQGGAFGSGGESPSGHESPGGCESPGRRAATRNICVASKRKLHLFRPVMLPETAGVESGHGQLERLRYSLLLCSRKMTATWRSSSPYLVLFVGKFSSEKLFEIHRRSVLFVVQRRQSLRFSEQETGF